MFLYETDFAAQGGALPIDPHDTSITASDSDAAQYAPFDDQMPVRKDVVVIDAAWNIPEATLMLHQMQGWVGERDTSASAKQPVGGGGDEYGTQALLWPEEQESIPVELGFGGGTQPSYGMITVTIVGHRLPVYEAWRPSELTYLEYRALEGGGGGLVGSGGSQPCETGKLRIDWDFIKSVEGTSLTSYVPTKDGKVLDSSGITIASGFDIGQHSVRDLRTLGLSDTLVNKLAPYTEKIGSVALAYYNANPKLTITTAESDAINSAAHTHTVAQLAAAYDKATKTPGAFYGLPAGTQTAFASVAFQYGNLAVKTPDFWNQMVNRDFISAIANLYDFKDQYDTRRDKEADLMEKDRVESRLLRHNVC